MGGGEERVLTKWDLKIECIKNKGSWNDSEWKCEAISSGVDLKIEMLRDITAKYFHYWMRFFKIILMNDAIKIMFHDIVQVISHKYTKNYKISKII